jgi:hypothetical protein
MRKNKEVDKDAEAAEIFLDFLENFGFYGKFWLFGKFLAFLANVSFFGKFWIFWQILDFRDLSK